ncbi:hypothetical protein Tco_0828738 [Tanacetum coccineum]
MTLNDFRRIFQLPQATDNNHIHFVVALKCLEMAPFFLNYLGFTLELRSPSNFNTTRLMLYYFVNHVHVVYVELLWEGLHYALKHPSTLIPYPRFTKLIVGHYMTAFPEISRRVYDKYHNLEHDEMVKSIFNLGKNKAGVGMKISSWMITDEMKLTKNYRMLPNPDVDEEDSSAQRKSTDIRLRVPPRQSTRPTPPTPILTVADVEDITLRDTIKLSIVEQKRHDELKAKQNVEKVEEHLMAEQIEKLLEGTENVENDVVDNSILNSQNDPGTRLEEEELVEDDYELRRREKGKEVEESRNAPPPTPTRSIRFHYTLVDSYVRNYMSGHILHVHPTQASQASAQIKFKGLHDSNTPYKTSAIRPRDQDDSHNDAHPEGENNAKRHKTSEHETYFFRESSSGQVNESEPGDEHQYHIDQMQNFLKNDIVWESRREILTSPFPPKPTPVVQSCQRDSKVFALSLVNQDMLYLKKGNSRPEKIVLSLHKFPAIIFPDDDIEERTSRWVDKCVKKFNPYDRYSVEHWKNPHAKIFYIKRQKEPRKPKEEIIARRENGSIMSITELNYKNLNKNDIEDMYLLIVNGKVDDYSETGLMWSLSVFIRSIVIWESVHDFQLGMKSYQQKVNLTALTITFPGINKYKMFSIVSEPVYGIIYKNNKKEKRVMRYQEVYKFCDATLKRVLEGLKSYNNNVKHGYVTPSLSKEDAEYL